MWWGSEGGDVVDGGELSGMEWNEGVREVG